MHTLNLLDKCKVVHVIISTSCTLETIPNYNAKGLSFYPPRPKFPSLICVAVALHGSQGDETLLH